MTLGISASGLDRIQARAAAILTDTVTITEAGSPSTNRTTLAVTRSATTVYSGAALITAEAGEQGAGTEDPGRKARTVTDYRCRLPITATGISVGATVTVTDSDDPDLIGATFRVTSILAQTFHSTRRLRLKRIIPGART